jgi:hypothetical protein
MAQQPPALEPVVEYVLSGLFDERIDKDHQSYLSATCGMTRFLKTIVLTKFYSVQFTVVAPHLTPQQSQTCRPPWTSYGGRPSAGGPGIGPEGHWHYVVRRGTTSRDPADVGAAGRGGDWRVREAVVLVAAGLDTVAAVAADRSGGCCPPDVCSGGSVISGSGVAFATPTPPPPPPIQTPHDAAKHHRIPSIPKRPH